MQMNWYKVTEICLEDNLLKIQKKMGAVKKVPHWGSFWEHGAVNSVYGNFNFGKHRLGVGKTEGCMCGLNWRRLKVAGCGKVPQVLLVELISSYKYDSKGHKGMYYCIFITLIRFYNMLKHCSTNKKRHEDGSDTCDWKLVSRNVIYL